MFDLSRAGAPGFGYDRKCSSGAQRGAFFAGQGLAAGTLIATQTGWQAIETIRHGARVVTVDHGLQKVVDCRSIRLLVDASQVPDAMLPVRIPAGAVGNRAPVCVPPEQGVCVGDDGEDDGLTIVPAQSLIGYRGIARERDMADVHLCTLSFDEAQLVQTHDGLQAFCPKANQDMADWLLVETTAHTVMMPEEAAFVVDYLMELDALPPPPPAPRSHVIRLVA